MRKFLIAGQILQVMTSCLRETHPMKLVVERGTKASVPDPRAHGQYQGVGSPSPLKGQRFTYIAWQRWGGGGAGERMNVNSILKESHL